MGTRYVGTFTSEGFLVANYNTDYEEMIDMHLPKRLKRLSVFEDFNGNYLASIPGPTK